MEETIVFNSDYWLKEKNKVQVYLAELIHGNLANLKSYKSDEDSASYHEMDSQINKVRYYLEHCKTEYKIQLELELESQGKPTNPKTRILYFERELGY